MYVEEPIAPGVVNTMPEATIHAFADHGEVRGDTITGAFGDAQQVLASLAALGIDYDDVVDTLEREGVEKFAASWMELLRSVEIQLGSGS
jgi:transaldolase